MCEQSLGGLVWAPLIFHPQSPHPVTLHTYSNIHAQLTLSGHSKADIVAATCWDFWVSVVNGASSHTLLAYGLL